MMIMASDNGGYGRNLFLKQYHIPYMVILRKFTQETYLR
jgi:hypothetical protein